MDWLYKDAIFLKENDRKKGCLCLLLCLMDALAKENNLAEKGNRKRYIDYLKKKLKEIGIAKSYRIEEKDKLVHLAEIIYEYFRCNLVHEGDSRDSDIYEVQIDYTGAAFRFGAGVLMDRRREKIIVRGDWLIDILCEIATTEGM